MLTFVGCRMADNSCRVYWTTNGHCKQLGTYWDECRHSPAGFEWGYGGSGPAQLAFAILRKTTSSKELAQRLHQQYKWQIVAALPRASWSVTAESVAEWITARLPTIDPDLAERIAPALEGHLNV